MGSLVKSIKTALGLDLKSRATPLNFKFPVISQRLQATSVLGLSFDAQVKHVESDPCAFFELIKSRVKHLNRCALSTRDREKLTDEITALFYKKAVQACLDRCPDAGIPEPAQHRKLYVLAAEICQILIVSNQILFDSYYKQSNFQFQRSRSQFRQAGLRIFELFDLNQQLKALRYQFPEKTEWQALQTVLYALKEHDTITQPQSSLKHQLKLEPPRSITSLFIGSVIFEYFRPLEWPTQLQWVIRSYLKSVPKSVDLIFGQSSQPTGPDVIMVPAATPASGNATNLAQPPMALNCAVLFAQIRNDCQGLIKALRSRQIADLPVRFAKFKEAERLVISNKLLQGIDPSEPYQPSDRSHQLHDLRLFVGFSEVFDLLQHQQSEFAHEERLSDALAKRSAIIAQDPRSEQSTLWTLIHQSPSRIRLSTQESSYTTPMKIGSLLAYGIGKSINQPCLTLVSRLERLGSNTVILDLDILSGYAEPVVISLNQGNQKVGHRALLIASQNSSWPWGLVLPPLEVLPGVDEFSMYRNGQAHPLDLETLRMATTDFSLFSTKLSSAELGFEATACFTAPTISADT